METKPHLSVEPQKIQKDTEAKYDKLLYYILVKVCKKTKFKSTSIFLSV